MCFVSLVMEHYDPQFRKPQTGTFTYVPLPAPDAPSESELRKLISEFKEAVEAAKKLDVLMKQPDCVDPEKAKLEARVAELERLLARGARARKPTRGQKKKGTGRGRKR